MTEEENKGIIIHGIPEDQRRAIMELTEEQREAILNAFREAITSRLPTTPVFLISNPSMHGNRFTCTISVHRSWFTDVVIPNGWVCAACKQPQCNCDG